MGEEGRAIVRIPMQRVILRMPIVILRMPSDTSVQVGRV